jgi:hypothetical protein
VGTRFEPQVSKWCSRGRIIWSAVDKDWDSTAITELLVLGFGSGQQWREDELKAGMRKETY